MGRETQAEVDGVMREAVHRLRARPELLTYVSSSPQALNTPDMRSSAAKPSPRSPIRARRRS